MARQGGHHTAVKSTRTGTGAASTASAKFRSVISMKESWDIMSKQVPSPPCITEMFVTHRSLETSKR